MTTLASKTHTEWTRNAMNGFLLAGNLVDKIRAASDLTKLIDLRFWLLIQQVKSCHVAFMTVNCFTLSAI